MWDEIVAFLAREWVGLLASIFVLVSFLFSNELKTRLINFVGCAIWVEYGFVVGAYSTSFMNGALIIVHIVKLTKMFIDKRKKNAEQEKTSQNGLQTESTAADKTDTADTNQQNTNK